uniref:Pyruvate ferredoxin oxidoreductase n=1 Tax=candidate division WOR-3 bacterium TaxID=2052148 RepID=A0A7C6EAY3_UNCW3
MLQIKLTGTGGQGIIVAGEVLAYAAVLAGKEGSARSSYGSAARGGITTAEVIVAEKFIPAPFVEDPDYIIALSQAGYDCFKQFAKPIFVIDSSTVKPDSAIVNQLKIPATQIAEQELKSTLCANMIMLGFFAGYTGIIKKEHFLNAIKHQISEKYLAINLKAFEIGYEKGKERNEDQ